MRRQLVYTALLLQAAAALGPNSGHAANDEHDVYSSPQRSLSEASTSLMTNRDSAQMHNSRSDLASGETESRSVGDVAREQGADQYHEVQSINLNSSTSREYQMYNSSPNPRTCYETCKMFAKLATQYAYDAVCDLPVSLSNTQSMLHTTFDASIEELRHGDWKTALSNTLCTATEGCSEAFLQYTMGCIATLTDVCLAAAFSAGIAITSIAFPVYVVQWACKHKADQNALHVRHRRKWYKSACELTDEHKEVLGGIARQFQNTRRERRLMMEKSTAHRKEVERQLCHRFPRFYNW